MTLIELLVGSVLAVILLVTILGVLRTVWRQDHITARIAPAEAGHTLLLREQVRSDFSQALQLETARGRVRLVGLLASDPLTGLPSLRPAEVTYRLVRAAGRRILVRDERPLDVPRAPARRQWLWVGAGAIVVVGSELVQESESEDAPGPVPIIPGIPLASETIVVTITSTRGEVICSEHVMNHREFQ